MVEFGDLIWLRLMARAIMPLFVLFFCAATPPLAQPITASPSFEIVQNDLDLQVTNAGIYWLSNQTAWRPLNDQGVEALRQFTLSFSVPYESLDVTSAYTLKKDGTKLPVGPSGILRGRGQSTAPGYDDTVTLTIVFPNVEVGDQVVLGTLRHQITPWFPGVFATSFSYDRNVVVREASLAVTTEGDDTMFHIDAAGVEAGTVERAGGTTRRTWRFHNDIAEKIEPDAIYQTDETAHVAVTSLHDYTAVAKLYAGVFAGKTEVTPEIAALATTITAGVRDKRAMAALLYNWVSGHIKYVDIVLGAGGFVPHTAAEILKNGYGDCKDHVMLLQALLAAKGIDKLSPVLIDAGSGQPHLPAAASPFLFDHLITYIPGLKLFVDSTAQFAQFGTLPESDAGEPVLVVAEGKLAVTPAITAADNGLSSETKLTIAADGSADGDTAVTARGASAIDLRAGMAALPKDSEDSLFQSLFGPGSTGQLDRGKPEDLTSDYGIQLHFHIASYAVVPGPGALGTMSDYGGRSILSMLGTSLPPTRTHDYYCRSMTLDARATITLPQTITVTSVPAAQVLTAEGIEMHSQFQQSAPDTLHHTVMLRLDHAGPTCSAAYYGKVRDSLFKMTNALRAQVLYK